MYTVYIQQLKKGLPKRNACQVWILFQHLILFVINADSFCCSDWERRHTGTVR